MLGQPSLLDYGKLRGKSNTNQNIFEQLSTRDDFHYLIAWPWRNDTMANARVSHIICPSTLRSDTRQIEMVVAVPHLLARRREQSIGSVELNDRSLCSAL